MKKFQNKYRIHSFRLQNRDYSWDGIYFITICTKGRKHYFGEIVDGKMNLSKIGIIADILWHEIKNHAKNVELGEFVVMPNHIHGILILDGNNSDISVEKPHAVFLSQTTNENEKTIGQKRFQNQGKNSIFSIVGSYKSAVSKHAHRLGYEFEWQVKFHDSIVRNDKSFETISKYIYNNPKNWNDDKFYN